MSGEVVCLTGGIGGAKLALGLYRALPEDALTLCVNTGDDFTHLGVEVWPDFDTALYTLSGLADRERGWGRGDESWNFMQALGAIGGETWFQLGDRDLALHMHRAQMLRAGVPRGEIATALTRALGVKARVMPACETEWRTMVDTDEGTLAFQDYFVRRRAEPVVQSIRYVAADAASPRVNPAALDAIRNARAILIAPSNPWLSIAPILALPGMREALTAASAPVVAVTPLIGDKAVKGPTAKIMAELGIAVSATSIARDYADVIDGFVLDQRDATLEPAIRALGLDCHVCETLMRTDEDKLALARATLAFADALAAT